MHDEIDKMHLFAGVRKQKMTGWRLKATQLVISLDELFRAAFWNAYENFLRTKPCQVGKESN